MPPKNQTGSAQSNKEQGLNQIELILIAAILRHHTDEEHPMKISEITQQMSLVTNCDHVIKSTRERLEYIITLTEIANNRQSPKAPTPNNPKANALYNMSQADARSRLNALTYLMGGTICYISSSLALKKKEYKFYFKPILEESDYTLIKGALTSNRYINGQVRNYLNDALDFLRPNVKKPNTGSTVFRGRQLLPTRPRPNNSQTQAALVLQKINTIYDAIRQNHQIIIQYGVYQEIHNTIELVSDPNKSYVLNPYALFWSNGQYYLIATGIRTADTDQILHFRVDRILDISPMEKKETLSNGNTVTKKCPRADIPNSLKPYFKQNIFQADLYRSKHPLMSYSQNNKEEEIVLHCSETSLSVLVDAFGAKGHMVGRTILYQKKNINLPFPNGYTVKLQDADYNAVKRFCLQMQNDIYVLEPARLKAEIIDELQKKLNIYKSM